MGGVEGYQNEGYTIMTLMRMTFGEFDVSCGKQLGVLFNVWFELSKYSAIN